MFFKGTAKTGTPQVSRPVVIWDGIFRHLCYGIEHVAAPDVLNPCNYLNPNLYDALSQAYMNVSRTGISQLTNPFISLHKPLSGRLVKWPLYSTLKI